VPLPATLTHRLQQHVTLRLPPVVLARVTPAGVGDEVRGYVSAGDGPLDALGLPERQARLHLDPDQPLVSPGDELDGTWVAWTAEERAGAWRRVDLRRLPPFTTWARERTIAGARDPVTRAPTLSTSVLSVSAHFWRARPTGEIEVGTERNATAATLILRGTPDLAQIGDALMHPEHGRYRVLATSAYGPWAVAHGEAF
jgi:hypothetical protein